MARPVEVDATALTEFTLERLQPQTKVKILVEHRVSAGYSATSDEHQWHHDGAQPLDVTGLTPFEVLDEMRLALSRHPSTTRNDMETRAVLQQAVLTRWVIA